MVECRARAEPLELVGRHREAHGCSPFLHVIRPDRGVLLTLEKVGQPERLDDIPGADVAVFGLVDEPERQDALFL